MVYANLVGKVVKVVHKQFMSNEDNCVVFKVKSVSENSNYVTFITDCYMRIGPFPKDWWYSDNEDPRPITFEISQYNIVEANEETLAHCKSLLKDSSKYYKLIGQEFSETVIKEVTLEEFQKNFPSYVPPAHTLHNSMKEDLKLVQKIQEGLEKLEKAPNQQNSLIVNKPQVKLNFL